MRRPFLLSAAALLALGGCTPRATIPDADRRRVAETLAGQRRFLRAAAYLGPFFGDRSKLLLSDQPAAELDLLETTHGEPIPPPAATEVLLPGTPVRIRQVEFPSGWRIASRPVMTPRYHPWVYLELPDQDLPAILVLSQTAASFDDVAAEVDRVLATEDPSPALQALPQNQRDAVLRKEPAEGMGEQALEMAWGLPEKKIIDRPSGSQEWIWAGGRRRAFFQDDRLVRWEPR